MQREPIAIIDEHQPLAFTSDFLDPSFRTPDEVAGFLESPALASLPKNGR
jgi:hypothetical protein